MGVECGRSSRCGAGGSRPVLVWSLGVVVGSCKDDLGAYNEPVVFDDATADALVTAASGLSSTISTMGSDVGVWASTASADFEGHYGDVFDSGAKAGQEDCTNISAALDDLVSEVRALKSAAATERRRRAVAKEWADRQDEENLFKQGWDWLTDGDKPPAGPAPVPLPEPHEPVVSTWAEPAPGAAGAVSSARPSDLRTYASKRPRHVQNIANGKPTKDPYVRVCVNCQDLYDEDMFPPKVPRDEGGRWSMQNGN